jgi:hypothetical protein
VYNFFRFTLTQLHLSQNAAMVQLWLFRKYNYIEYTNANWLRYECQNFKTILYINRHSDIQFIPLFQCTH